MVDQEQQARDMLEETSQLDGLAERLGAGGILVLDIHQAMQPMAMMVEME
jgi:hypothetical protein